MFVKIELPFVVLLAILILYLKIRHYNLNTKMKLNHTELSRRLAIELADTPSAHAYKLVSNTPKIRTFKQEKKRSKDQFAN